MATEDGVGPAVAAERKRTLDRTLIRTSHLFADTATLREAMTSAADVWDDVSGEYVAVVAGLAVAYAHSRPGYEPDVARRLVDAAHGEPSMLDDARAQLEALDFLALEARRRADRLLAIAGDLAQQTGWPAETA